MIVLNQSSAFIILLFKCWTLNTALFLSIEQSVEVRPISFFHQIPHATTSGIISDLTLICRTMSCGKSSRMITRQIIPNRSQNFSLDASIKEILNVWTR